MEALIEKIRTTFDTDTFVKINLSKPVDKKQALQKVMIKKVLLKDGWKLSFVLRHQRRDMTKNYTLVEAIEQMKALLNESFDMATLFTTSADYVWRKNKSLRTQKASIKVAPTYEHNHQKARLTSQNDYKFLLGLTNEKGTPKSGKGDKIKQIHKFVEIVDAHIPKFDEGKKVKVYDMGAGKGYLTFACYEYLSKTKAIETEVIGVDIRPDLIQKCNGIAEQVGFDNLSFEEGFISDYELKDVDVLIALHACDTATDDAIYKGISSGAQLIICSPCCHKQIRKQMKAQSPIDIICEHGIFEERQAEMLTDTVRVLLMEAMGYKAKAFEFISSEHTGKNLMLVGVYTGQTHLREKSLEKLALLKKQYGFQEHYLETLLKEQYEQVG